MNKTERRKLTNKLVYKYAESLGYEVDMTETDVNFISSSGNMDDHIEYRRSSHSVCCLNWACEKTLNDTVLIESYVDKLNSMDDNVFDIITDLIVE